MDSHETSLPAASDRPAVVEAKPISADTPEALSADFRSVDPRVQLVWGTRGFTRAVFLGFIALFIEMSVEEGPLLFFPGGLALLVLALLSVQTLIFVPLRYRMWRFAIRRYDVLVHHGVLWRMRRCVPRNRVQHVDISSGPVSRALGLVRLMIYTAGTTEAVVSIPGLAPEEAERFREELLRVAPDHA